MTTAKDDRRFAWHPYRQHAVGDPPPVVVKAKGAWLTYEDGTRLLDGIASWWTCLHGHGHPSLVRAIASQAKALDHVEFASQTHEPGARLARRLVALAPEGLARVFYSDDGSTAVECALKMALAYWRRNGRRKTGLMALAHAYHGDTAGAMSVSDQGPFTRDFQPLLFGVNRLPIPTDDLAEAACLARAERIFKRHAKNTAALILEPLLMGASGMRLLSETYLLGLRRLCRKHEVLFIADEVMTGFGRTGTLFATCRAGLAPDIMCVSKAITGGILPLAATLSREEIFEAFLASDIASAFLHGHSYTANPIACAAALASLRLLTQKKIDRGVAIGNRLGRKLRPLARLRHVKEVRGIGIVRAVELRAGGSGYLGSAGSCMAKVARRHGVLLRPLGNVLYALPPLCVTDGEVDRIADAMKAAVRAADSPSTTLSRDAVGLRD